MRKLIILEMANNHSGSLSHGKDIVSSYHKICQNYMEKYEFVFKFQYRNLDTFIRPDMKDEISNPLIKRFSETKLSEEEYVELLNHCRANNFGVMVTPFDEDSVEKIINHNVDYIKIASCSFNDWPLLEKIASSNKKIVASCANANLETIKNVVSFFTNRNLSFRLQHCVGEYPTSDQNLNVAQVSYLKKEFPNLDIGFSSHEDPSRTNIAPLALALGASSFEKHVALETNLIKKNAYSTSPEEFRNWLISLEEAEKILGSDSKRYKPSINESTSLKKLQRGVFSKRDLKKGESLNAEDIYFAFPPQEGQILANDISKYSDFKVINPVKKDSPLIIDDFESNNTRDEIVSIALDVCKLINISKITVPSYGDLEISHHFGLDKFREFGLTMLTVVNREYCKKILILLAGQHHPEQFHNQKEETFHVLWGHGTFKIDDEIIEMKAGDTLTILPKQKHSFTSKDGIIIEEISSTHFVNDSFYTDEKIMQNKKRKTFLTHWRIA